jgi:capsular polysaccharide biosynthesis protein
MGLDRSGVADSLYVCSLRNAVLDSPTRFPRGTAQQIPVSLNGWTENGDPIREVSLYRNRLPLVAVPRQTPVAELGEPCIYAGLQQGQFGHFLTESLARMWAILKSNRTIVWLGDQQRRAFCSEILGLLGIDERRFRFVTESTRFADLEIPVAGLVLGTACHSEHAAALGVYPCRDPVKGKRVWLSRSGLADRKSGMVNEPELEELLAGQGWLITHPQQHSLKEQLETICDAEILAGFDGSAFHTILLARDLRARLLIVPRGTSKTVSPTFAMISAAKAIRQTVITARATKVGGSGRGSFKAMLDDPMDLLRALDQASVQWPG